MNEFRDRLIQRIKELKEEKPSSNPSNNRLEFDPVKAILYINDSEVNTKKSKHQTLMLKAIFEDKDQLFKEWPFADIGNKDDEVEDEKVSSERYRNTVYRLNDKVAIEAHIKDFFVVKNNSFQINKVYFKSS